MQIQQVASSENFIVIDIHDWMIPIEIAEDDFNADKKTLFATYVWSGSKVLANYLVNRGRKYVEGRTVLEFGAAAGLPSIVCAKLGASRVCASDYPSPTVIGTLRRNIQINDLADKVQVVTHIWGQQETIHDLLIANHNVKYDLIIAAECLWRHECHKSLLKSMQAVIAESGTGHIIVTYSHHIPGMEKDDDNFFELAYDMGFTMTNKEILDAPHMWVENRLSKIYICELTYMGVN